MKSGLFCIAFVGVFCSTFGAIYYGVIESNPQAMWSSLSAAGWAMCTLFSEAAK